MLPVVATSTAPAKAPNVHPSCRNTPGVSEDGFEELCHLVTERDPDIALCGKDVTGYPWNPPVATVRGLPGGLERGDELTEAYLTCVVEIPKGSRNKYE